MPFRMRLSVASSAEEESVLHHVEVVVGKFRDLHKPFNVDCRGVCAVVSIFVHSSSLPMSQTFLICHPRAALLF
jgi:hypothetical protein